MPLVLDGSGGISGVDGTASNPAIEGTDSNTGIFYPAADTVAIGTGGTEALRVNSSQNVGIGTTSPNGTLTINKVNLSNGTVFLNGATTGADFMRLKSTGADGVLGIESSSGSNILSGSSANATVLYTVGATPLQFGTNSLVKATLDSSGNLGLGVTPSAWGSGRRALQLFGSSTAVYFAGATANTVFTNNYYFDGTNEKFVTTGAYALNYIQQYDGKHFWQTSTVTAPSANANATMTSMMTLAYGQGGQPWLGINATTPSFYENFYVQGGTGSYLARFVNTATAGTAPYGLSIDFSNQTPNNTTSIFLTCNDPTNTKMLVYSTGTVTNRTGTYNSFSDLKLKQDIVDASSQWNDIKALRVVKYRLKDEVAADSNYPAYIGLVAQEAEQVSPGLVEDCPDFEMVEVTDEEGNTTKERRATGTVTKSIKYSILYMKAVKALQEAMTRIEALEAEVQALKGTA